MLEPASTLPNFTLGKFSVLRKPIVNGGAISPGGLLLSATQPPRPPQRHNFVVSAITFEGFKLRSSNLTHALLIQISRTSLIIDIVVPSKMAAGGHFVKKNTKLRIDLK